MEIVINSETWREAPFAPLADGNRGVTPDWSVLRSRFLAAHAARRLFAGSAHAALPAGSFDATAAAQIALHAAESGAVNPIASTNRKPGGSMDDGEAGISTSGDRG
jgi:hypothetical protein